MSARPARALVAVLAVLALAACGSAPTTSATASAGGKPLAGAGAGHAPMAALPEGFGDDRLVTVPLTGQHDMRLGYIKLRSVPLSESGREFVDILRQILRELEG